MAEENERKAAEEVTPENPERASPELGCLETIVNPHPDRRFVVRFTCPEFTCLCPLSARPDFAHLVIDYLPDKVLLESRSLKLFLASFRNHRGFHEDCTIVIASRIEQAVSPHWLRVGGYWYPRGGIPIDIFYQSATPPEGIWIPPQEVGSYRGR